MINNEDLEAIGIYLYGVQWKHPLSEALKIGDSTLRAIYNGSRHMNDVTEINVYKLAANRQFYEILPLLQDIAKEGDVPFFKISPVQRTWSKETDRNIKQFIVAHLNKCNIRCEMGE